MTAVELKERAYLSACRIMRSHEGKHPLPDDLACESGVLVGGEWVRTGAVTLHNDRISVAHAARKEASQVAKTIEWMSNPNRHHGQQAGELAKKTIRALRNHSISAIELFDRCREFRRLRKKHIDRNSAQKQRTRGWVRELRGLGIVARRITSEVEIDRVGHALRNCLANEEWAKDYKTRLRLGSVELIVLETNGAGAEPLALMSIDKADDSVDQVKAADNNRPIQYRDALIAVLMRRKTRVRVGECADMLELAICDQLLEGRNVGVTEHFTFGKRECEVGKGFLAIVWDDSTVLLRSDVCESWSSNYCVIGPTSDATAYFKEAEVRVGIRKLCGRNPDFADACREAFQEAPSAFRLDWFSPLLPTDNQALGSR